MRFELTEEQQMLRDVARDFATQTVDDAAIVAAEADAADQSRMSAWKSLGELGLVSLLVPADLGGSGGSVTDACVVAEALGEVAAPLPYVSAAIAAPAMMLAVHADDELAALAAGATSCVLVGRDLGWPPGAPEVVWDWLPGARGLAFEGPGVVTIPLEEATPVVPTFDPLHPVAMVERIECRPPPATDALRRTVATARVGSAAFALGLAQRALDVAVDYARDREQYGRPIGSFQAIQHLCADMLVDVEASRSIVLGASWKVEHAIVDEAARAGAAALAWTGRAAVRVCEASIQVLGGIGVTIEHTAHRRLRSAHHFNRALGGSAGAARALGTSKLIGTDG